MYNLFHSDLYLYTVFNIDISRLSIFFLYQYRLSHIIEYSEYPNRERIQSKVESVRNKKTIFHISFLKLNNKLFSRYRITIRR